jgi:hypothetical protein
MLRHYKGQNENKRTNNIQRSTTQIEQHEPHLKLGVDSGVPKWLIVDTPLVTHEADIDVSTKYQIGSSSISQ